MPLQLEDLLHVPELRLQLVAGGEGLRRRGPVTWVHASEIPDPSPWLEGGEVLLTTGLGVLHSPQDQRRLMADLDARGTVAVGFGVGVCIDEVPPVMLAEADARALPLFTVPYEVPFIAVTKHIARAIFAEHYATLRSAVELHRRLLAAVLAGRGLDGVVATVARSMPDHACLLYDYYGSPLAQSAPPRAFTAGLSPQQLWGEVGPLLREAERAETGIDGGVAVGAAVRLEEQVEAYLVLVGPRALHEHEQLLLEQGLTGVSLELARGLSAREARRAIVDDLLEDAMGGRLGGQALAGRLERLGLDPTAGYVALSVVDQAPAEGAAARRRSLSAAIEDVLATRAAPVLGRWDGNLYALAPAGIGVGEDVSAALRRRGLHDVVGRSNAHTSAAGLPAAVREAHAAAVAAGECAGGVRDIGSLGLQAVLAGVAGAAGAAALVERMLGPVQRHDDAHGTKLEATLRAYLRHGCRPGPAAQELCVHRHTLSYRLDRIRDLTGCDPRDGEHLLTFGLVLELCARKAPAAGG